MGLRMWILPLFIALSFLGFSRADTPDSRMPVVMSRSCSYAGVFHVEGSRRYALNFMEAGDICVSLETTLASLANIRVAFNKSMETCRYGWISDGNVTILRQNAYHTCANNQTGIIFNIDSPKSTYDAYCYDEKDQSDLNCKAASNSSKISREHPTTGPSGSEAIAQSSPEEEDSDDESEADTPDLYEITTFPDSDADSTVTPDPETLIPLYAISDPADARDVPVNGDEDQDDGVTRHPTPTTSSQEEESDSPTGSGMLPNDGARRVPAMPADRVSPITAGTDTYEPDNHQLNHIGSNDRETGKNNQNVPDWMIILVVVLIVLAVVLVAAAVATRNRWCGKHQTLMITKEGGEGNGAAPGAGASSRSEEREQEMVTLMHKENIQENGKKEEFTVIALEEKAQPEKAELA